MNAIHEMATNAETARLAITEMSEIVKNLNLKKHGEVEGQ